MRAPSPSLVIAVVIATLMGGALLLSGASWPEATPSGTAAADTPPVEAAYAPAVAYDFHPTRTFAAEGDGVVPLTIPSSSMRATISVWFEGAMPEGGAIRVLDPEGAVVVETVVPVGNLGFVVGGRNNEKTSGKSPLMPGEWRVEFEGGAGATGHAHIRTG